jgi:hypothetical protein
MNAMRATAMIAAMTLMTPGLALASDPAAPPAPERTSIRAAAERMVEAAALPPARMSDLPTSRPYQGRDRSRKQMGGGGGGKSMMIIGMVTALAGTAATIYMVKEMTKNNNDAARSAGQ